MIPSVPRDGRTAGATAMVGIIAVIAVVSMHVLDAHAQPLPSAMAMAADLNERATPEAGLGQSPAPSNVVAVETTRAAGAHAASSHGASSHGASHHGAGHDGSSPHGTGCASAVLVTTPPAPGSAPAGRSIRCATSGAPQLTAAPEPPVPRPTVG